MKLYYFASDSSRFGEYCLITIYPTNIAHDFIELILLPRGGGIIDSAKNHKRKRRKRQSVTAKREKSQTQKFV